MSDSASSSSPPSPFPASQRPPASLGCPSGLVDQPHVGECPPLANVVLQANEAGCYARSGIDAEELRLRRELAETFGLDQAGEVDARSAAASLDLIEEHKSTETTHRLLLKTETYPSGARRYLLRQVDVTAAMEADRPSWGKKRDRSEQERVDSSVQRTKKMLRQHCMAKKVDRLLTLTYRDNMQDRRRCYEDCVRFITRARAVNLLRVYVAVAEQQKRGAWHVHIAIRGYMPVLTLRRLWRNVVGELGGNIDIAYRHRGDQANSPWRIAAYLSKYIGKAVAQLPPGERSYWASEWHGLAPVCTAELLPSSCTFTQVVVELHARIAQAETNGEITIKECWQARPPARAAPGYQPPYIVWAA